MPIYEYLAKDPGKSCRHCGKPFEVLQAVRDAPLRKCPECGSVVKRIISWCRSNVMDISEECRRVESRVKDYESAGMWSHAAELADKHSEKTKDKSLRLRALDNYRKAGYDASTLSKHADFNND
jgi:putative FmdB family regulatory protein